MPGLPGQNGSRHNCGRGCPSPAPTSPPSSSAPSWRAIVTTSGPSASRSARRSMPASSSSTRRPARSRCRSRRWKWPRRRRQSLSTAQPIQVLRLVIFSALRSSSGPAISPKLKPKRPKNRPLFGSLKRRKTRGEPRVFHFSAAKTRPHRCAMRGIDRYNLLTTQHM